MSRAYYNEIDRFAAQWLRNLIVAGHIAPGDVDERDIREVQPEDVRGYAQCHWFAGLGGWSYALRFAGWPDDRPIWTGSCPCQPFSSAGRGLGCDDPRHLWPAWVRLIRKCRPDTVCGEQVEAAVAHGWLDLVCDDLEGEGYAVGSVGLPACSVGAPHIRQRLWWVAQSQCSERGSRVSQSRGSSEQESCAEPTRSSAIRGVAESKHPEWRTVGVTGEDGCNRTHNRRSEAYGQPGTCSEIRGLADSEQWPAERYGCELGNAAGSVQGDGEQRKRIRLDAGDGGEFGRLGVSDRQRCDRQPVCLRERGPRQAGVETAGTDAVDGMGDTAGEERERRSREEGSAGNARGTSSASSVGNTSCSRCQEQCGPEPQQGSPWTSLVWLPCRDGKARPTQPGLFPLAHGVSGRVGRLRAYGNAIVPQVAAEFIRSFIGDH